MSKDFIRQEFRRHLRLGKLRKSKRVWRRPKGRHSKMREKRRSYPQYPTIGHRSPKQNTGKIKGLIPLRIRNLNDLKKATAMNVLILAKIGAKKKLELIKEAKSKNLTILNIAETHNEA